VLSSFWQKFLKEENKVINYIICTLDPPRIQLNPQRQVVRPGDVVYITCSATGDQPITTSWSKVGGILPPAALVNNGQLQVNSFLKIGT
jgi:hypothetical protein